MAPRARGLDADAKTIQITVVPSGALVHPTDPAVLALRWVRTPVSRTSPVPSMGEYNIMSYIRNKLGTARINVR